MKNFVEYLLVRLIDHPDELQVTEQETAEGLLIQITVNPEDMGRVIGKGGKVIKSVRKLVQVKAARDGIRVRVEVAE
ncbi:MAG: RNA-binding protein [Candidatus Pacebacteria bacterium CG10_big_fil_rev_8_21_14_0_10_36_11]|nr:KH domain-containing protein [Candidatus Pacearchaeota archaeon]OIP74098.1 MAG: RNA-binding protein [Candidatus Pacebacteria bacterium CG2_30_36_39]PIR64465.1 MAG: RNA-binding protein [Candidatus Pacebacteria bacterium CG10_big_fil_rev_8_21_14_0_10_36_11]PJC42714.1 MAG: RNA-binding protein [Candidatus Pacebacteria bacterium CG_4_9_14_0_2_um_filter_36_8]